MDDEQAGRAGGMPGEAHVYPWLERLLGRSLADVRVHDSSQAGALAGRLGARAFAAGRHIYVRPDLLRPLTPQGVALLAHELTHAVEQSGAPALAAPAMPLLMAGGPGPAAPAPPAVQRAPPPGGGEHSAVAAESAALRAAQPGAPSAAPPIDPQAVADRVYRRIVDDLRTDRERHAGGW
jgi:hypothetical protein